MRAILGGFQEQRAILDGLKNEVAHLAQRITAVEQRLGSVEDRLGSLEQRMESVEQRLGSLEQRMESVEQGLSELRGELHAGLDHLGERWLQHDRDIYTLKHRQA